MFARDLAIAAALLAGASVVQAGPKEQAIDALLKCADISDKDARVACFDAATPQLRAAAQTAAPVAPVAAAPVSAAPASAVAQAEAPPQQQTPAAAQQQEDSSSGSGLLASLNPFGSDAPPSAQQMAYQPLGQEILPVAIGVARFGPSDEGGFEIKLDNGQVWRERNEHYDIPPWRSDARNIVYLERGMLGGYNLYLRPFGKIYKVVRVK
ncbi:MAG TPA: hypothetical protein VGM17_03085 [Rhizomicrobium sp.]|jgi:hypothetical protein